MLRPYRVRTKVKGARLGRRPLQLQMQKPGRSELAPPLLYRLDGEIADIDEVAGDGSGGGHYGAD